MKELLDHYEGLIAKLKRDYRLASEYYDGEAIHEVRVDIKRMRALLNFASVLNSGNRYLATQEKLEKLFKRAGKLRHYQLLMELARRYMDELGLRLDSYFNILKQHELYERKRFQEFNARFDRRFLVRNERQFVKDLGSLATETIVTELRGHCDRLLKRVKSTVIGSDAPSESYHAVRILAKETRYSLELLRKCTTPIAAQGKLDQQLLGLHQALGAWHDFDLAASDLEDFLQGVDSEQLISPESLAKYASVLSTERDLHLELFRVRWLDFGTLHSEVEFVSVAGE